MPQNTEMFRLIETRVRVPATQTAELAHPPIIEHWSHYESYGFADLPSNSASGIIHRFHVTMRRNLLDGFQDRDEEARHWESLRPLRITGLKDEDGEPVEVLDDERLLVGHLRIEEFPVRLHRCTGRSWWDDLDAIDGDAEMVGEIADRMLEDEAFSSDYALLDGSLFFVRTVSIIHSLGAKILG